MNSLLHIIESLEVQEGEEPIIACLRQRFSQEMLTQTEEQVHPWKKLAATLGKLPKDAATESIQKRIVMRIRDALCNADEMTWKERVAWIQTRDDALMMFHSLGIENQWKSSKWISIRAIMPPEKGGIGIGTSALLKAIPETLSLKSYPYFLAWMEGKSEPEKSWPKRVAACITREDFLALFKSMGIPGEEWKMGNWMMAISKLSKENGGINLPLSGLGNAICKDKRFNSYVQFVAWMEGKEAPDPMWPERIASLKTTEDFLALFSSIGIPGDSWKNCGWMINRAQLPQAEGGIGVNLCAMAAAIRLDERFENSYPKFVAWMEGKERPDLTMAERVQGAKKPADMRALFTALGIPGEKWRNSEWLGSTAGRPIEEGGIGKSLAGITSAIRNDPRFRKFNVFLAWMDEKETPELSYVDAVRAARTPEAFQALFESYGIPGKKWRSSSWMSRGSAEPVEKGGVGHTLTGVVGAIRKDPRFGTKYKLFLKWMDASDMSGIPYGERIAQCIEQKDFLELFKSLGIPGENWRSHAWMSKGARLSPEKGGVGRTMIGLYQAITDDERFKKYAQFIAWMDGREAPDPSTEKKIAGMREVKDFLSYFQELGIPQDMWESGARMTSDSKKSVEDGGIGKPMSTFVAAIRKEERFSCSYPIFVAWLKGEELPLTPRQKIATLITKEDFLNWFKELGIPDDKWKSSGWMQRVACKPAIEGGIGKGCTGVVNVLKDDPRFGSYKSFLSWMTGEKDTRIAFHACVRNAHTQEDFLALFREWKIPENAWKSGGWILNVSRLSAKEGGIGKNLGGFATAIVQDDRFKKSYPYFVAWMEGKDAAPLTIIETVALCKTPADFYRLFEEWSIPADAWRSVTWLTKISRKAAEEGGIGKSMRQLLRGISGHPLFCTSNKPFRLFTAWMDGYPLKGIQSAQEATELIQREAERLKVSTDTLLHPENIGQYLRKAPALKHAMSYFQTKSGKKNDEQKN